MSTVGGNHQSTERKPMQREHVNGTKKITSQVFPGSSCYTVTVLTTDQSELSLQQNRDKHQNQY